MELANNLSAFAATGAVAPIAAIFGAIFCLALFVLIATSTNTYK